MKAVRFIAIMLFMLFTVGSASAEEQTAILTGDDANEPNLPNELINVKVTYNPGTGTLTYTDSSSTDPTDGTYLENPRIDEVAYNLPMAGDVLQEFWGPVSNTRMDGFGSFTYKHVQEPRNVRYRTVTLQLEGPEPYPLFPSGNVVAVHLAFDKAYKNNVLIAESTGVNVGKDLGSTYLQGGVTNVPEFPTMALPVAAILGLLFITQRRKEN